MPNDIVLRLHTIHQAITTAAQRVGRDPAAIRLIAVSKTQPIEKIHTAIAAGQTVFGENYAQELKAKVAAFTKHEARGTKHEAVEWHFIGHLQRNKVKDVVPYVQWIHTIDSLAVAQAIAAKTSQPIHCCLEINVAGESTKHGLRPDAVDGLIEALRTVPNITVRGLMCIPPIAANPEASRPYFRRLATILADINRRGIYPTPLTELSMGMTNDFTVAIEEGATMIRIGTAIFGERI